MFRYKGGRCVGVISAEASLSRETEHDLVESVDKGGNKRKRVLCGFSTNCFLVV